MFRVGREYAHKQTPGGATDRWPAAGYSLQAAASISQNIISGHSEAGCSTNKCFFARTDPMLDILRSSGGVEAKRLTKQMVALTVGLV